MQVELDGCLIELNPGEKCLKCDRSLSKGMVLHNTQKNCEENVTFPHMEIGQRMHIECYIQHTIDSYLEKLSRFQAEAD